MATLNADDRNLKGQEFDKLKTTEPNVAAVGFPDVVVLLLPPALNPHEAEQSGIKWQSGTPPSALCWLRLGHPTPRGTVFPLLIIDG